LTRGKLLFAAGALLLSAAVRRKMATSDCTKGCEDERLVCNHCWFSSLTHPSIEASPRKKKTSVDKEFLNRLKVCRISWRSIKPLLPQLLIPIVLPGVRSKEALLLLLHTGFLVARTLASIYVAK